MNKKYEKILIAICLDDLNTNYLHKASGLLGSQVESATLVYVARPLGSLHFTSTVSSGKSYDDVESIIHEQHMKEKEYIVLEAKKYNFNPDRFSLLVGKPSTCINKLAKNENYDLIVMGKQTSVGLGKFLGTVATDIIKHAPCDTLVIKPDGV